MYPLSWNLGASTSWNLLGLSRPVQGLLLHYIIGHVVTLLVEAMRYKPEGRGFDSRWCHWNFPLIYFFWPHYGPGVDSASNRNEYQEYFLGVKAAGAWGWQPYHLHVPTVMKSGSLNLLEISRPVQVCNWIAFTLYNRARGKAVGWGTVLQAGRSRVQFPMVSLDFFIDIILPAALWPRGWLSL